MRIRKHQPPQKLKKIVDKIVKEYKPEKIILFGSYAWGKPRKDSDVDLFIVKKDKKNFLADQQIVRKIIDGEIAADVLIYTPIEIKRRLNLGDFFFENIINNGIYIYGK